MTKKSKPANNSGKPRIVFFGNERIATGVKTNAPTLQALISQGYEICAVVSNFKEPQSRNARQLEIQTIAQSHNIPLLFPERLTDISDTLRGHEADIGVLIAYGKIVPQSIIDIFPKGIINIHPSLLPLHRGPTPIESAILSGESKTGVSLMGLAKAMDAGPVFGYSEVPLDDSESKQALADILLETGKAMLIELLPRIIDGTVVAAPQNDSNATYDKQITKADGVIDWNKPAARIEREVRAFLDWPKSRTKILNKDVIITKSHVLPLEGMPGNVTVVEKSIVVFCAKDALQIDRLKPAGKNEMNAEAFLAGYKIKP